VIFGPFLPILNLAFGDIILYKRGLIGIFSLRPGA
jgi:hypothetical protein